MIYVVLVTITKANQSFMKQAMVARAVSRLDSQIITEIYAESQSPDYCDLKLAS